MIERKRFIISFPRFFVFAVIGISAFAAGVFVTLPVVHGVFARVNFAHVSVMAEVADTPDARIRGLSGRPSIAELNGVLFVNGKPEATDIWMKDMKFPIDILWIRNGVVIDMKEHAPSPIAGTRTDMLPIYHPQSPADFVLETVAGFSGAHGMHIGDRVSIELRGKVYAYTKTDDEGAMRLVSGNSASLPVGHEYFIDTLRSQTLRGSGFVVGKQLETNDSYDKFAISYISGDLTISGVMNVPKGAVPQSGFPILILNHGLIPPPIYTTGRGSKREQDFFGRHGYITIHPDYRGHASSSPNSAVHHDFYVGYTQDVTSLLDAIERSPLPFMDATRIGVWGHSMGGGITNRVMVLRPEVKAFVLFAPISADVEDNFYELTPEEIQWLHDTYGKAGDPVYRKMSPIEYFGNVAAPVQIHQGTADTAVSLSFAEKIYQALKQLQKSVEYFIYPGQKHELIEDWPLAANRALQFFDHYVKKQ